jgi:hypothetical protein
MAVHGAEPGLYIQFESQPGIELRLESLEDRRKGIEVVAVQQVRTEPEAPSVQRATVFVPDGELKHFVSRFQEYATERTAKGEPRHKDMIDRIAALRRASLRALWTDDPALFPEGNDPIWWEVWLRRHDGRELERLLDFAEQMDLVPGKRRLAFEDRIVVLVRGTSDRLARSLDVLNDIAEVRGAKESAAFFVDSPPAEQVEWVAQLVNRTTIPADDAPAVCILDTGVTRGHPLLTPLISAPDATAVDPSWGPQDDGGGPGSKGHGTEMAGLAAYGDLAPMLLSAQHVHLRHRLESVKILPPTGANPPELYGAITAQAVARPEVTAPDRLRAFALAVTATDERDRGQPTSWSAAIDALAAGRSFDPATQGLVYLNNAELGAQRLFIVSTGNVSPGHLERDHLNRSDLEAVHDPAQAWNALTVGAYTEKAAITHNHWNGWSPLAPAGDLCPWSTTSVLFQDTWPTKPDVVFEGGNVAVNGSDFDWPVPDICLLSTHYKPVQKAFTLSFATSAATAQVARMAAIVRAEYPDYWPETVRALIVHSAKWTRPMEAHLKKAGGKRARARLLRRYGFGVPRLEQALRSASDSLTLVAQSVIHPFTSGRMREMHVHELPWPTDALEALGEEPVRLRVTLSYFIEPNPGRRGWKRRHSYASHGLRFEVKSPTEDIDRFRKRLNQKALEEEEHRPQAESNSTGWYLGEQTRNKGSIHSDVWVGTAADLAARGVVGIYPISGWWKEQPARDRSNVGARYALLVSIETKAEDIDIWAPVAAEIGAPIEELVGWS